MEEGEEQGGRGGEREEAEYRYHQERERRLEEEHADRKAALDKELRRLRKETEQEHAKREATIQARGAELQRLSGEGAALPERLERAVQKAGEEAQEGPLEAQAKLRPQTPEFE